MAKPKELSEMPLEELCHLIEVSSHKRFRMAKAQELQALARFLRLRHGR